MSSASTSSSSVLHTHWLPNHGGSGRSSGGGGNVDVDALCLGTGRFLRSVLVPALVGAGFVPALIQTRGRNFLEYMHSRSHDHDHDKSATAEASTTSTYEVDTVLVNGNVRTDKIPCYGAFSFGRPEDKTAFEEWIRTLTKGISIIGVGVTEAGLQSKDTKVMKDLYDLLKLIKSLLDDGTWKMIDSDKKLCVIDMDNVPNNGDVISKYMIQLAEGEKGETDNASMKSFLTTKVAFLNTMVDRITSQRPGSNGLVPRCEPCPAKALVILDPEKDFPRSDVLASQPGVVIRSTREQLTVDINLKLRIANGTHTAIAHTLALLRQYQTDVLAPDATSSSALYMKYLDALVEDQIVPAACKITTKDNAMAVWNDWRQRLIHPQFGLSSFFITQNGPAKGGIRWSPTVIDLLSSKSSNCNTTVSLAFAYAALLRWLTPIPLGKINVASAITSNVHIGWLDGFSPNEITSLDFEKAVVYADGMRYNENQGWYEFKCPLTVSSKQDDGKMVPLTDLLQGCVGQQPNGCVNAVTAYMNASQGGNLSSVQSSPGFEPLINAVAVLYSRLVNGDSLLGVLQELDDKSFTTSTDTLSDGISSIDHHTGIPLLFRCQDIPDSSSLLDLPICPDSMSSVMKSEVSSTEVIDLHTHLLPPTHSTLCLWGIDELLTYHYLVAEYFQTAPANVSPEKFYDKTKQDQADMIWQALFLDRMPISEACRGVITTLISLGLENEVRSRDLDAIRSFYKNFRERDEVGASEFTEKIFALAGVRYAIMTNIPFDSNEAQYWRGPKSRTYSSRFRSALRVDPLLAGDTASVTDSLVAAGYNADLEGARQYINDWIDTMKPEYLMASTPHDFVLQEGDLAGVKKTGVNMDKMSKPFAFVEAQSASHITNCDGAEDDTPTVIDEHSDLLGEVLMKVCEERDLPVALKIGARRGINAHLKAAGDGMVFADSGVLARLCTRFPRVRFLATFLSKNNQHEACVLANKFRNLHIYGCWWYCNNPSIIREITTMRIEMLGTAFTAQHSDARVVDQLVYKWSHSRGVIASVLGQEMKKLCLSGWTPTRRDVRREVRRILGGSYEEFMAKSLK